MAMEGTHIRFALEYRDAFGAADLRRYLSGTVYPDSRYVTKIVRSLTHDDAFISPDFYHDDDFKKGWAAHLLYDEAQYKAIDKLFGELLPPTKVAYGNEHWLLRSAIKILQEMDDLQHFNIKNYITFLNCPETPNAEDPELLHDYYTLLQDLYALAPDLHDKDYEHIWTAFSGDAQLFGHIQEKINLIKNDPALYEKILILHRETLKFIKI